MDVLLSFLYIPKHINRKPCTHAKARNEAVRAGLVAESDPRTRIVLEGIPLLTFEPIVEKFFLFVQTLRQLQHVPVMLAPRLRLTLSVIKIPDKMCHTYLLAGSVAWMDGMGQRCGFGVVFVKGDEKGRLSRPIEVCGNYISSRYIVTPNIQIQPLQNHLQYFFLYH